MDISIQWKRAGCVVKAALSNIRLPFYLVVAFVMVFLIQMVVFQHFGKDGIERLFVLTKPWFEPWTLLTHLFAHDNLPHLRANLVVGLVVGVPVAAVAGRYFWLVFFIPGALAGLVHILVGSSELIGASAGTKALAGFALATSPIWISQMSRSFRITWRNGLIPRILALIILASAVVFSSAATYDIGVGLARDVQGLQDQFLGESTEQISRSAHLAHVLGSFFGFMAGIIFTYRRTKKFLVKM